MNRDQPIRWRDAVAAEKRCHLHSRRFVDRKLVLDRPARNARRFEQLQAALERMDVHRDGRHPLVQEKVPALGAFHSRPETHLAAAPRQADPKAALEQTLEVDHEVVRELPDLPAQLRKDPPRSQPTAGFQRRFEIPPPPDERAIQRGMSLDNIAGDGLDDPRNVGLRIMPSQGV